MTGMNARVALASQISTFEVTFVALLTKRKQDHLISRTDGDDDEEPDEGKYGPEHGDEKNCVRFHTASFIFGDHKHAEGRCS